MLNLLQSVTIPKEWTPTLVTGVLLVLSIIMVVSLFLDDTVSKTHKLLALKGSVKAMLIAVATVFVLAVMYILIASMVLAESTAYLVNIALCALIIMLALCYYIYQMSLIKGKGACVRQLLCKTAKYLAIILLPLLTAFVLVGIAVVGWQGYTSLVPLVIALGVWKVVQYTVDTINTVHKTSSYTLNTRVMSSDIMSGRYEYIVLFILLIFMQDNSPLMLCAVILSILVGAFCQFYSINSYYKTVHNALTSQPTNDFADYKINILAVNIVLAVGNLLSLIGAITGFVTTKLYGVENAILSYAMLLVGFVMSVIAEILFATQLKQITNRAELLSKSDNN